MWEGAGHQKISIRVGLPMPTSPLPDAYWQEILGQTQTNLSLRHKLRKKELEQVDLAVPPFLVINSSSSPRDNRRIAEKTLLSSPNQRESECIHSDCVLIMVE